MAKIIYDDRITELAAGQRAMLDVTNKVMRDNLVVETDSDYGVAVTPSGATASATSGTLTDAEYATLTASKSNYILFNGDLYYASDWAHTRLWH